jgi:long-chain acyl-CoA synthetase
MPEVWAFDVDGTLVDSMSATSLRPGAVAALQGLRGRGHLLVLWSAGGAEHCEAVIARHGLRDLFVACYDKPELVDGRLSTAQLPVHHQPQVVVDDRPAEAPLGVRVIAVPPYMTHEPDDRALLAL